MSTFHAELALRTSQRESATDITDRVRDQVGRSGIRDGLCVVASRHTTAAVFVNENADPDVLGDLLRRLDALVPESGQDRHAEGNSPAHVKAILVGSSVTVPVRDGELDLGRWQGIFFADFDGPRERVATVTVSGDRPH